ncbi:helix-turn-helix transcriptional regulator [Cyclobacterium xiamenense]|uniref:helix-turn-helix transcriptional regulator n=1 Tax=Cyclobacterium xiamenense TaxID=1297121 RepID=UPI0012BA33EA|nr:helix-turn-helix domain-containing protein [Cyclobacterium xiamenense]
MSIQNPFAVLDARLANIEGLLLDLKHPEELGKEKKERIIVDTDQLLAKLNVTRPTLAKWRKENRIPYIQVGSVVRYDLEKVLEALETGKKKGK